MNPTIVSVLLATAGAGQGESGDHGSVAAAKIAMETALGWRRSEGDTADHRDQTLIGSTQLADMHWRRKKDSGGGER